MSATPTAFTSATRTSSGGGHARRHDRPEHPAASAGTYLPRWLLEGAAPRLAHAGDGYLRVLRARLVHPRTRRPDSLDDHTGQLQIPSPEPRNNALRFIRFVGFEFTDVCSKQAASMAGTLNTGHGPAPWFGVATPSEQDSWPFSSCSALNRTRMNIYTWSPTRNDDSVG